MEDVFVYLVPLPTKIREMITPCDDGYTVYLNSRLTQEAQEKAYNHALLHIEMNDFELQDVQEIEGRAHNLSA